MNGFPEIQIGNPEYQPLFWFVLVGIVAILSALVWRRRASGALATPGLLKKLLKPRQLRRPLISALLTLASLVLLVVATLDLRWGRVSRQIPQRGIEVVFVLDVSRSMLAEDVAPNRLERAKQMINDTLAEMAGDSVGLVLFAGAARQAIPVTNHYDEFRTRLDAASPDDIDRGGSRLGDAIRVAKTAFLSKSADSKAVVLLTDGEDMESDPIDAAKTAHDEDGVTIFTIGLGDMTSGARIPVAKKAARQASGTKYLEHRGEPVWSKLDGTVLDKIAKATGGSYIPAGTKNVNMTDFYQGYLAVLPDAIVETRTVDNYEARFQWFLAPAIALLLLERLISWQRKRA